MSVLRTIEHTIEGLVERSFGRAFRSHLQPVELARKLAREMEQNKTVSVSQVYVPNEFTVYLSTVDRARFQSFESSLSAELGAYLAAYARGEGLSLLSQPYVIFMTDEELRVGEFGIACRTVDAPEAHPSQPQADAVPLPADEEPPLESVAERPADQPPDGAGQAPLAKPGGDAEEAPPVPDGGPPGAMPLPLPTVPVATVTPAPVPAAPTPPAAPAPPVRPPTNQALRGVSGTQILSADEARAAGITRETLVLSMGGTDLRLSKRVTTIGRGRDNDLVVPDPNVSRAHAEIRHVGLDYYLVDMDSTNGVEVNGRRVKRHALANGDRIVMGTTEIRVGNQ